MHLCAPFCVVRDWPHVRTQTAEVAFTGDTSIDILGLPGSDVIFTARLLIIECTFLDDAVSPEGAKARGHMHVRDLAAHADKFQVRRACFCLLRCAVRAVVRVCVQARRTSVAYVWLTGDTDACRWCRTRPFC